MMPYPHYCAIHRAYYGSPTDTIPATMCPLCGIKAALVAQPAPRTYEVARALSWVEAVESSAAYMPAVNPVALLQSVSHIKKALATYHRLRANKEPAADALKSIDNAIFNEEHVLNAIAAAAPSPATPEAEGANKPNIRRRAGKLLQLDIPAAQSDCLMDEKDSSIAITLNECEEVISALLRASPPAAQEQKPVAKASVLRELATRFRADSETFDTRQKRIDYIECASIAEHPVCILVKAIGQGPPICWGVACGRS